MGGLFRNLMADRVVRKDGETVLLFRCETDGELILGNNLERHQGHKVKAPVSLNFFEQVGITMGWIK